MDRGILQVASPKNVDQKGRWRNVIVSFRVSPEESEDLNRRVKLSGYTKQDYIINRISEKDVVVIGSPRVYKALKEEMDEILSELRRIENGGTVSDELARRVELVENVYSGMNGE